MEPAKTRPLSSNPREIAVRALQWVFVRHRPLDHFFEKDKAMKALVARDQALVRAIVGTCLRHLGQIDALLANVLNRPLPRNAYAARQILRAGLAELLFLRSAPHGVVHSLVQLAGNWRATRPYKGLMNAVFRRIGKDGKALLATQSVALNIPDWPGESWEQNHGPGTRPRAARVMANPPPLDITLLRDMAELEKVMGGTRIGHQSLRLAKPGRVEDLPDFAKGNWIVQDLAAALPAQILAPVKGEHIADLCAAPGGKTMQLAATGANITAIELSPHRLKRLAENLDRTGLSAKMICADACQWKPEQRFDAILLDAPCSATGIFRHHPDVLYNARARDMDVLVKRQLDLAHNAARQLKPGGRLVYCVCSAEPEEGEAIISRLLQTRDLVLDPIVQAETGLDLPILNDGRVRIMPGMMADQGGLDAFYIARLRKPDST